MGDPAGISSIMKFEIPLHEIKNHLLVPDISEAQLIKAIGLISEGFTTRRDKIDRYVRDEALVSAYAYYYLPTNIPKFFFLFEELERRWGNQFLSLLSDLKFIDFGCGPGTFSLAYLFFLKSKNMTAVEVELIDSSSLMLEQAEKLIKAFFPEVKMKRSLKLDVALLDKRSLVFFGHSLNELDNELAEKIMRELVGKKTVEHIFWIEPGTPDFFKKQKSLRKILVDANFQILYPCTGNLICPMEQVENDWCHQILRLTHSDEIERLSQLVGLDRKILPMISFAFSRTEINRECSKLFFPVRFLNETKYSFEYLFCSEFEEARLSFLKGEILKKSLAKKEEKELKRGSLGITVDEKNYVIEVKKDFFRAKKIPS